MILNEDLDFQDAPNDVKAAFSGNAAKKIKLNGNHQLYKFTQYTLSHQGKVTPWWSSVEPISANDTGLEVLLQRSAGLNVSPADFSRARNAVTKQWNSMSGLLIATLQAPAWGFVGGVRHQPVDSSPEFKNVVHIGGAIQLWIPNLTPIHIRKV